MSDAPAPEAAPRTPDAPEKSGAFIRTFPCTSCGARFSFAPGTDSMRCEFCGAQNAIPAGADSRVEETDFGAFVKELEGRLETWEQEEVRCEKCGAEQKLEEGLFAAHCAFCGAGIVSKGYAHRRVRPSALVPFRFDRDYAQGAFRKWVRRRWLAPNDLKRYAKSDATLTGLYLPFWTYDCRTSTDYKGRRGTKRDKSIDWTEVTGHVDHFFDDVMILASKTLPESIRGATDTWNPKGLVPYQPEFVSGFRAEAYQVTLSEGYLEAKKKIDARIRELIERDIGGDDQAIDGTHTLYGDLTFKHVLMPVWISAYRYRDKVYRFLVNGQTGETSGESPLSWWKVTLLAIVGLFLVWLWAQGQ